MKTISPIKFLTAVGFLIVSLESLNAFPQNNYSESADAIKAKEEIKLKTQTDFCKKVRKFKDGSTELETCVAACMADTNSSDCKGSSVSDCKADLKEYRAATSKASGACDSFEKVSGTDKATKQSKNTCDARINACRKKINSGVGSDGSADALMKTMTSIYVQKNFPNVNPNDFPIDGSTTGPSCTNFVPKDARKEKKSEQKDLENQIKDLNKSISEEKKKITDENAKLREKNAEIDSDIQKVEESLKKDIAKVEGSKRDRLVKLNEEIAKSATNIRNINSAIIKRKEESESIKFDYAQKMQQFTADKITTQCQTALDNAKQCFLKSRKGQLTSEDIKVCGNLNFSGNGAKGTAQLKAKMQKVQDACFEGLNMTVSKANFEQGKSLRTIETDIIEKTNQVNDATNALNRNQEASTAEDTASAKESADVSANSQKQIDNLKTKLERTTKSTQEAVQVSNERLQQLANQLNDLNTKKAAAKMGIADPADLDNSLADAEEVIQAREDARKEAMKSCCPGIDPEKSYSKKEDIAAIPAECRALATGGTKQADDKGRSSISTQGTSK